MKKFGLILVLALLAFEIFNAWTINVAVHNLLGDATIIGIRWATIGAYFFCLIDPAIVGISRWLMKPDQNEPTHLWYWTGAWLLLTAMNSVFTWWSVLLSMTEKGYLPAEAAPISVIAAVLAWVVRLLIIWSIIYWSTDRSVKAVVRQPFVNKKEPNIFTNKGHLRCANILNTHIGVVSCL